MDKIMQQVISNEDAERLRKFHRSQIKLARPSFVFKPKIYPDGNIWCALYGEDLQNGICGFGNTPDDACADFDKNFQNQTMEFNDAR